MRVKICGITQVQQALDIVELGANALGFICVRRSPRFIEAERIATIVKAVRDSYGERIATIGVFVDPTPAFLEETVTTGNLSGVQLHGDESPEVCQEIRATYPDREVIKALRVRNSQTLASAANYQVDALLLDAYHPQELGGTGHQWDWSLLQTHRFSCPWLLAGGLNPENVRDAIASCHPDGIDLSSGVESAPGVKDLAKVQALFTALNHDGND
ncbi:MAG: phosphoribosylanthranilate isomerase [Cyanobacteria bacterium P01_F01_bin.42]